VRSADVVERMASFGAEPGGGTPEQFAKLVRDEHEAWKTLIQRANIKPE
jgi:tripartite-type tricarboxylate transporter receptor subunit TctC